LVAYNLSVEEYHTYYVGEQGLWVHNAKCSSGVDNVAGAESKTDTLQPGPFAKESIPARGPERNFTKAEREKINNAGQKDGCHTCGSTSAGTKSGNFILDHQPPNALNPQGGAQRLFPHCSSCSARQAGQVTQEKRRRN
jgi:hypothetical protein